MKKRNVFLSALFTAFFAVLMLGPLMSEAQAASNDLDSYLSTMGDAAKDAVGTLKSYAEYDLEKVNTKAGPRVNPNLVKAAKVLKIIGFLEIGSSVVREIKEVVTAYEREGLVAATIEGIGGLLTVGISIYGGILAGIAGAKCAVLPLAAGPMAGFAAFGGCHWVVSKIASILADNGERGLEAILRKLFLHDPGGGLFGDAYVRRGGRTNISVSVDGAVTTSATGSGSKATTDIGTSRGQGGTAQVDIHGNVTTISSGRSTARTDVGVASGKRAKVVVNIDGTITTIAAGRSESKTEVGVASGDRSEANVSVDGSVTTIATGHSKAKTSIGVASGNRAKVMVDIDGNIVTLASGAAQSTTEIGVARGKRSHANASVKGSVVTRASGVGRATAQIGIANGSGNATAHIKGNVITVAPGMGRAQTQIGTSSGGRSGSAYVNGTVLTQGGLGSANTKIGTNGTAFVKDVMNFGGGVSIGGGGVCQEKRNGQCCLQIYLNRCVTQITPSAKGACPPLWYPVRGLCYFIPDYSHIIRR